MNMSSWNHMILELLGPHVSILLLMSTNQNK